MSSAFKKTVMVKSNPRTLPAGAFVGPITIDFPFGNPELPGSKNLSDPISNDLSGLAFTIESVYFSIPQLPGVSVIGQFKPTFNLGNFTGGGVLSGFNLQLPLQLKNPNWEQQIDLKVPPRDGFSVPNSRRFYWPDWLANTIDVIVQGESIDPSFANKPVELEIFFVVSVNDEIVNN